MSDVDLFRAVAAALGFVDAGCTLSAALARVQALYLLPHDELPRIADLATTAMTGVWRARALRAFDDTESPRRSRATNTGSAGESE